MKKLLLCLFLVLAITVLGWHPSPAADTVTCADAVFQCKNKAGGVLGTIAIPCSLQVPFNDLVPTCLPNMGSSFFKPMDECRTKFGLNAFEACPTQSWPSGYNYSQCMRYPSF